MKVQVDTANRIVIDGQHYPYLISQTDKGTRMVHAVTGQEVTLPHPRYVLSTDIPSDGRPGAVQLGIDLLMHIHQTHDWDEYFLQCKTITDTFKKLDILEEYVKCGMVSSHDFQTAKLAQARRSVIIAMRGSTVVKH